MKYTLRNSEKSSEILKKVQNCCQSEFWLVLMHQVNQYAVGSEALSTGCSGCQKSCITLLKLMSIGKGHHRSTRLHCDQVGYLLGHCIHARLDCIGQVRRGDAIGHELPRCRPSVGPECVNDLG